MTMDRETVAEWLTGNGHLRALLWAESAGMVQMPDEVREPVSSNRQDVAEIATMCQATGIGSPRELTAALNDAEPWAPEAFTIIREAVGLLEDRDPYLAATDAVIYLLIVRSPRGYQSMVRLLSYFPEVMLPISAAWAWRHGDEPLIDTAVSPFPDDDPFFA